MNNTEIATWLFSTAEKLRTGAKDTINVSELLQAYGVQVRFGVTERRSGALGQSNDGKWVAIIRGKNPTLDRFTIAHELGHFLLIKHLKFSPTIEDKRNYYFCEDICDQFAAKLLINYNDISALNIASSKVCLGQVRDIATRYQVSNEAAARSIIETHSRIGICAFEKTAVGCLRRLWGVSSLSGISPRYGKKRVKLDSIKEEMRMWGAGILGKNVSSDDLDFASESGLIGLSAIIINAGQSDRRSGLDYW
jgi:Zn-dependent peptidase ImmA (M78 family)